MRLTVILSIALCGAMEAKEQPEVTEVWQPVPSVVDTSTSSGIPSDAIVLFDGSGLQSWVGEKSVEPTWNVADGMLTVKPRTGGIVTKRAFDDCQLHIEWCTPERVEGTGQNRGNSGIFFQGRYELQILDSFQNPTYVNGQAASVYKQQAPLVNASRAPGQWQVYDVVFRAPRFNADGSLRRPAYMTVFHNGVMVHDHTEIQGATVFAGEPGYSDHPFKRPLLLQDHRTAVSFRNIWIRELSDPGTIPLFNGKDLSGWYTFLKTIGTNNDPENIFQITNGALRISGKTLGYVATENEYGDYHLKAEFKWGQLRWPPRANEKRDSGILYHFAAGLPDKIWPRTIECQVQEGDCGDIWLVGTDGESPGKMTVEHKMKRFQKEGDYEYPRGEWNTLEVVAIGDRIEHYVNGHLVNTATRLSVQRGKILLESEWAEVWFRNLTLTPLQAFK